MMLGDRVAVGGSGEKSAENEEVEGALKKLLTHCVGSLLHVMYNCPMKITLLFLACSVGWADVTVGTATAKTGQRATGFIQIPAGVDAGTNIPVIVINGAKPGPKLVIVAGAHGTEYASIIALEKLGHTNPADLSGTLIVLPLINLASFAEKVPHVNPVDGKNMNRMYPGKADGTQTERASWAIAHQVIEQCDFLIDLHGGDLDENLRAIRLFAGYGERADGQDGARDGAGVWARPCDSSSQFDSGGAGCDLDFAIRPGSRKAGNYRGGGPCGNNRCRRYRCPGARL